jgi:integrase/recombinase XerD
MSDKTEAVDGNTTDLSGSEQPTTQPALHSGGETAPPMRADSTLSQAVVSFDEFMLRKGFSENTIKAFRNDLKIVVGHLGPETRLLSVSTDDLNDFLQWLQHDRKDKQGNPVPCGPKSLARRITTVKVFFGWLHGIGVIGTDPAGPVAQQPARPPLPEYLTEDEVKRLLRAGQDLLLARQNADARPYLLVSLLLQTGLKKAECARLLVTDVDVSNPSAPELFIRYNDEEHAHKNRTLALHPGIINVLNQYLEEYKPGAFLFDCTPRNLEYVLDDLAARAAIKRIRVGFESLRWTCAMRDFRLGTPEERLRIKLGLTKISWRETREKIYKLTGR